MNEPFSDDPFGSSVDPTHFPADKYLESAVLGAILLDPPVIERLDFLEPTDFYSSAHQDIYQRMLALWAKGDVIDPLTVADRDRDLLTICNDAYANCPSSLGVETYARKLKDLSVKRRMGPFLATAAGMSMNGASAQDVLSYLHEKIDETERSTRDTWQLRKASGLAEPPAAREWLLEGLIFRGQISMYYGPPGIRKSLLLMDMCAAMATGQNWLVRRAWQQDHPTLATFHATRPARILWLDYDNGEFETEVRVRAALTARDGLDDAEFYYMSETIPWLALDNASHVRRVIKLALDVGADVIVFDALGMVLGEVDENAPDVAKVIAKLKEIRAATGAAILCVHHPSKSGAQTDKANTYNAAGSAKFSNFFEWTVELRAGEENGTIVASVVKHRGWAKTAKFSAELDFEHFGDERPDLAHELKTFKFYPAAIESAGDKRKATIKGVVLEVLAAGEMNQKDLITAIKKQAEASTGETMGDYAIRTEIKRMAEDGELVNTQSAPRQPIFYALPTVDPVDPR